MFPSHWSRGKIQILLRRTPLHGVPAAKTRARKMKIRAMENVMRHPVPRVPALVQGVHACEEGGGEQEEAWRGKDFLRRRERGLLRRVQDLWHEKGRIPRLSVRTSQDRDFEKAKKRKTCSTRLSFFPSPPSPPPRRRRRRRRRNICWKQKKFF